MKNISIIGFTVLITMENPQKKLWHQYAVTVKISIMLTVGLSGLIYCASLIHVMCEYNEYVRILTKMYEYSRI